MRQQTEARRLTAAGTARNDLKVRVAWLYYIDGLTQEQIARQLDLSRVKVLRLLASCREEGIVQIRINSYMSRHVALARALEVELGLAEAIVVPASERDGELTNALGYAAGTYISEQVRPGMSIGIGWGATLHASLRAIEARVIDGVSVVSLLGSLTHSTSVNPSSVAWRLADAFGADCFQLTAPVFVSREDLRAPLWSEPNLAELRARASKTDLAIVSVGDVSEEATVFRQGLLSKSDLDSLHQAGAVGDVLCHFISASGELVKHPANELVMAIAPTELRQIDKVVIVAGGARKVDAIRAAIRSTGASGLITDENAAATLVGSEH
jgi:DNA-binding transcriptional regulator LsrR (DeoR family)